MFRQKSKSVLSALLALILVLTAFFAFMPAPVADAVTQSEIDSLQAQRDALEAQEDELQSTISSLKGQQSSTVELKTALDEKNTLTLQQIQNLEEQIDLHEQLIEQKEEEIDETQAVADEQLERYKVRLRNMEENGRYNYLEVLFGANSIGEFLSLIDDIGDIIRSDEELEASYLKSIEELKSLKAEYEEAQNELKTKKSDLEDLSAQLEADIAEATALIAALQSDINANASQLASLAAQSDSMDDQIDALRAQLAEQNKKKQQESGSSSSGSVIATGSLMWPSYTTYVSSPYGYRIHPIYGTYKFHGGVDIAASYGTAIWAADSGTVVTSSDGWNGGYGNYICIDHGNGVQTLYAHMSSRAVSAGQTVSKGQVIGYVGSTGASTGAHIHFEVWNNGSRVNPMSYFS